MYGTKLGTLRLLGVGVQWPCSYPLPVLSHSFARDAGSYCFCLDLRALCGFGT